MRTLFPETTVIAGAQIYPYSSNVEVAAAKAVSIMSIVIYPVCMSMGIAVFLYQIVLEKETRLLETMKINGMKMSNYWYVNFVFNLAFYGLTAFFFYFFGSQIFKLQVFTDTNMPLMFVILFGWGLA